MSIASCQSFTGWQTDEYTERNRRAVRLTDWLTESINQFINVLFNAFFFPVFFSLTSFLYKRLSPFLLFLILTPLSLIELCFYIHFSVYGHERERECLCRLITALVSCVARSMPGSQHSSRPDSFPLDPIVNTVAPHPSTGMTSSHPPPTRIPRPGPATFLTELSKPSKWLAHLPGKLLPLHVTHSFGCFIDRSCKRLHLWAISVKWLYTQPIIATWRPRAVRLREEFRQNVENKWSQFNKGRQPTAKSAGQDGCLFLQQLQTFVITSTL